MAVNNETTVAKFTVEAGGYDFTITADGVSASIKDGYVSRDSQPTTNKGILNTVIAYAENAASKRRI